MNIQAPVGEFSSSRRELISALRKLRRGDFSVRMPEEGTDADVELATLFNEVVSLNQQMTGEFERISRIVGKEGKIGQRAKVTGATGDWETKLRAINELIDDMVQPTVEVARVNQPSAWQKRHHDFTDRQLALLEHRRRPTHA